MKKLLPIALFTFIFISACDGWVYQIPTFPAPPSTITPSIFTPTPVIMTVTNTPENIMETESATATEIIFIPTDTLTSISETLLPTATLPPVSTNITVNVLGCNTSIDILHGMGEVTNAFVNLRNNTGQGVTELCTTLFAIDEDRVHPDKTACIPMLEFGQQVTFKLTVDSSYKKETPIQVEVKSGETLLARVDSPSCTNIGLLEPEPKSLSSPVAIP